MIEMFGDEFHTKFSDINNFNTIYEGDQIFTDIQNHINLYFTAYQKK